MSHPSPMIPPRPSPTGPANIPTQPLPPNGLTHLLMLLVTKNLMHTLISQIHQQQRAWAKSEEELKRSEE